MVEHHRTRPDLADRVGYAAAGDVRRGTMNRLEHRWVLALGIDVAGRRDADRADDRRPQIGQNIAEQIRPDHHIEPIGMTHEMGRQDIDVVLVGPDVGVVARDCREPLVPERHRVNDAVRLGRRGDVLLSGMGQLERIAHDPVAAAPRKD